MLILLNYVSLPTLNMKNIWRIKYYKLFIRRWSANLVNIRNHKKSPEEAFKFLDKGKQKSQMEKINEIEKQLEELRNEIESLKERIK